MPVAYAARVCPPLVVAGLQTEPRNEISQTDLPKRSDRDVMMATCHQKGTEAHVMKRYPIACEISGPTAMWTRPDTGDAPVSYPAPSFAAVKGIFESIV